MFFRCAALMEYIKKQKDYANMLINIGEGNCDNVNVIQYEIKESIGEFR